MDFCLSRKRTMKQWKQRKWKSSVDFFLGKEKKRRQEKTSDFFFFLKRKKQKPNKQSVVNWPTDFGIGFRWMYANDLDMFDNNRPYDHR